MAKDRNILCVHYVCHGVCNISRKECEVAREMQKCSMYEAAKDRKPYRENRKQARKNKELERRGWDN